MRHKFLFHRCIKHVFEGCVCKDGAVGNIADYQLEGPGFNPQSSHGIELWATLFRYTVRGQGR